MKNREAIAFKWNMKMCFDTHIYLYINLAVSRQRMSIDNHRKSCLSLVLLRID